MSISISPFITAKFIQQRVPNFQPQIGLILGSGLGSLADHVQNKTIIPYSELPGFPVSTVAGHTGNLVLGHLQDVPVACLQGRVHGYEGATAEDFKLFIRTLKIIGCHTLLITNAAGSLREDIAPGELMLINDHINFNHRNPLIGSNDDEFGPRFFAMNDAYDDKLRACLRETAQTLQIKLTEGVYLSVTGPSFETPAEIRAFRILGADAVGMSTIPEVIIARHCGLRLAVLSAITNYASGMRDEKISHEGTLHHGQLAAQDMSRLILEAVSKMVIQ